MYLQEQLSRMKSMMGLITESVTLPMKVSGSYRAPKGDGDALHSFDRRKSDKFGGYMLRGGPIPSQYQSVVTLDQGKGINQVLDELIKSGVSPDVTNISITVNDDYSVNWEATIDNSKDGKAYAGIMSRGSAGGGADSRAEGQLGDLQSNNKNFCNWTQVLDLNVDRPIKIRQYFFKYTLCNPNETQNQLQTNNNTNTNKTSDEFKTWEPGEYKIPNDETWTYRLTDNKDWEAKKNGGNYISLNSSLTSDKFNAALNNLKSAKKI